MALYGAKGNHTQRYYCRVRRRGDRGFERICRGELLAGDQLCADPDEFIGDGRRLGRRQNGGGSARGQKFGRGVLAAGVGFVRLSDACDTAARICNRRDGRGYQVRIYQR